MPIILTSGRPAIDIVQGSYSRPAPPWQVLGDPSARAVLEPAIEAVGRHEETGQQQVPYLGTAFVVAPNLVLTLPPSKGFDPSNWVIDFAQEALPRQGLRVPIEKVLLKHPHLPLAFCSVTLPSSIRPLALAGTARTSDDAMVAMVGYPARDRRQDEAVMTRVFDGRFEIKRLLPGRTLGLDAERWSFLTLQHDCTSTGGCGNAPVIDVADGTVVGLQYAGVYLQANYAVAAWELARDPRIRDLGIQFVGDLQPPDDPWREKWGSSGSTVQVKEDIKARADDSETSHAAAAATPAIPPDRPRFAVRSGLIGIEGAWADVLAPHRTKLELALRATGRVHLDGTPRAIGNCFLVGDRLALTTGQIAKRFADGEGVTATIRNGRRAFVDFQPGLGVTDPSLCPAVEAVAFIHPYFDVAMLVLEAVPHSLSSLALASIAPGGLAGRLVAVIAHVQPDYQLAVQPGQAQQLGATAETGSEVLNHDCAAPVGSLGAPLLDLGTGYALGVCSHAYQEQKGGGAEPSWELGRDPKVWEFAVAFRPDPRPPWLKEWSSGASREREPAVPRERVAERWTVDQALDWSRDEPITLETLLRVNIAQPDMVTYLGENAGIPPGTIDTGGGIRLVWRAMLKEAQARGKLRRLVEIIAADDTYVAMQQQLRLYL